MPRRADEPETASNHIRPNRRTTTAPVRTRPGCDPSSPQCQRVVTAITPQISNRCEKSGLDGRSHVGPGGFCGFARAATENRAVQTGRGLAPNHLFVSVSATESRTTVWQLM